MVGIAVITEVVLGNIKVLVAMLWHLSSLVAATAIVVRSKKKIKRKEKNTCGRHIGIATLGLKRGAGAVVC